MTIENKEIITMKAEEDLIIITKQKLNDETKVKKNEIVVETKYEHELKNNEEFEVINFDSKTIQI